MHDYGRRSILALAAIAAAALSSAVFAQDKPGIGPGADLFARFDKIDADRDGKLTLAEIERFRVVAFAEADRDGDGALSQAELAALRSQGVKGDGEGRAAAVFSRMDRNGDGLLSAAELPAADGRFFRRLDADGDGALSRDELGKARARWLAGAAGGN